MVLPGTGRGTAGGGGGGARRMLRPEISTARRLRRAMTLPEVLLWQALRRKQTRFRFRRQHPIGPYIADFFCPSAALVVEVDGGVHGTSDRSERDAYVTVFCKRTGTG